MSAENQPNPSERPEAETAEEPEILSPETGAGEAPDVAPLQAELADLKDRLLRAAAEMENLRRRHERELADARQYAVTSFARDLLPVGDNLARALDTVPAEGRSEGTVAGLFSGVEMTERELQRVLERHGVRRFDPKGNRFDPHKEQAMFEVEDDTVEAGTVVQVVQPGYLIGERVLRPALVGVAKAGSKPAPPPAAETPAEEPAPEPPAAEVEDEPTSGS